MVRTKMELVVLVKAAPVLTQHLEETMCVAGARLDEGAPEWVRLHPVPFRDLDDESRFTKYQVVAVTALRPKADRRPESWSPLEGTISASESLSTKNGWAQRRRVVEQLHEAEMCDLVEANRSGSGRGTHSLAVVRPVEPPTLEITRRADDQLRKWEQRAAAAASRLSLFEDPGIERPPVEVVPWRFRYRYRCLSSRCNGHAQTIVDWEALSLWRHVRGHSDWQSKMREKLEQEMWSDRETVLFVGNQEQHPISFLVLGVFWPPAGPAQASLAL